MGPSPGGRGLRWPGKYRLVHLEDTLRRLEGMAHKGADALLSPSCCFLEWYTFPSYTHKLKCKTFPSRTESFLLVYIPHLDVAYGPKYSLKYQTIQKGKKE